MFLVLFVQRKHKGRCRNSFKSLLIESKTKQSFQGKLVERWPLTERGKVVPKGTLSHKSERQRKLYREEKILTAAS